MHSGTKYFGGHSNLLCGMPVVKTQEEWDRLQEQLKILEKLDEDQLPNVSPEPLMTVEQ